MEEKKESRLLSLIGILVLIFAIYLMLSGKFELILFDLTQIESFSNIENISFDNLTTTQKLLGLVTVPFTVAYICLTISRCFMWIYYFFSTSREIKNNYK